MAQVSIRDLCDDGGELVDRATRGEKIVITRSGRAVAELRALPHPPLSAEALLSRWRPLPPMDPVVLRADVNRLLETPDFIGMASGGRR